MNRVYLVMESGPFGDDEDILAAYTDHTQAMNHCTGRIAEDFDQGFHSTAVYVVPIKLRDVYKEN